MENNITSYLVRYFFNKNTTCQEMTYTSVSPVVPRIGEIVNLDSIWSPYRVTDVVYNYPSSDTDHSVMIDITAETADYDYGMGDYDEESDEEDKCEKQYDECDCDGDCLCCSHEFCAYFDDDDVESADNSDDWVEECVNELNNEKNAEEVANTKNMLKALTNLLNENVFNYEMTL